MNIFEMREKMLGSDNITVIAPKATIAEILLLLNMASNWSIMTNYDILDDNILQMSKLEIKNPKIIVETAVYKDGRLNYTEGKELLIEKSSKDTLERLGVFEELEKGFKDIFVFEK